MPRKKTRSYGKYIEEIGGVLYASVNLPLGNGKYKKKRTLYESLGSKPTEAIKWALAELDRHKNEGLDEDKRKLVFADAAEWYKNKYLIAPVYENGIKVKGLKDYERLQNKTDRMIEYFGNRKLSNFNEFVFEDYAEDRRNDDEVLTATINRDFALLRKMFRAFHKRKWIEDVPVFPFNLAAEQSRDRVLSFAEEKRLLAACVDKEVITKPRKLSDPDNTYETEIEAKREHLRPIIIIAVDTAMRQGEIFSLTLQDIDFKTNQINIQAKNVKGQKARSVGMTPRVTKEIERLSIGKVLDEKLFDLKRVSRSFDTACNRAGIKNLHFHDLRHTAITRMIRAGIPHLEVMKISGHLQLKTFLRYLNLQPDAVQNASQKLAEFLDDNE